MITRIAREAIVAQNLLPADNVVTESFRIDPDWDGNPKILVQTEPAKPEDETQLGIGSMLTVLVLTCVGDDEPEVQDLINKAGAAVYQKFEELENTRRSGILCITYIEHDFGKIPDTCTFQAYTKFNVLFTLTQ
jgi:hypothetical protein